jgi:hypothetical protein
MTNIKNNEKMIKGSRKWLIITGTIFSTIDIITQVQNPLFP